MRVAESARSKIARNFYRLFNESGHTSNELRAWCAGAIRRGADFEAVWTHILKYNSLVCGQSSGHQSSNATLFEQSRLRALAAAVQDQKCDLVLARRPPHELSLIHISEPTRP